MMRLLRFSSALVLMGLLSGPIAAQAQVTFNSVTLSWTTPGDDSLTGTASQFDLRYSTGQITAANFASATRWTAMPTPAASGSRQSVTVGGLQPNTTYYFAIKTGDDVPNWSGVSNVISKTTLAAPDEVRPAAIQVQVSATTDSTATLAWVAVGDDSLTGTAATYDIRYSTSAITAGTWASATQVTNEPTPAAAGASQSYVVRGLSRQATYYFAIKALDEASNPSALSNVPSVLTPDTMAPAAVRDLSSSFVWFAWHATNAVRSSVIMEASAQ